jgi:hypothetical protein
MPSIDTIRTLTVKASADGVDDATKSLQALSDAQGAVAVTSDTMSKSTLSASSNVDKLQKSLDPTYRSTAQLQSAQTTLGKGLDQGVISLDRYNQLMALASQRFDDATHKVSPLNAAVSGIQSQMVALSAGLGPVGVGLAALGPVGLAVGVGLKLASDAIDAMSSSADALAAKATVMSNFAAVTGLTTDQVQALTETAAKLGVSSDETQRFIDQFTSKLTALRTASGPLYDAILKVDAGIAQQMLTAKGTTAEFDLYAQAWKEAAAMRYFRPLAAEAPSRRRRSSQR